VPHPGIPLHIAVVTPAWNVAPFIDAALRSVMAQTHAGWSMVVVDDGSTDDTAARVARIRDRRITLIRQGNRGVSAARNRGIEASAGDAVLFLDADDVLAPDAMARLASGLAAEPGAVAAYGPYARFPARGRRAQGAVPPDRALLHALLIGNRFANGGHLLIRRTAVDTVGWFREALHFGEDWEYWVRLALCGRFTRAPGHRPTLYVRDRAGSAYRATAHVTSAYTACLDAVFSLPALRDHFSADELTLIRSRAEAERDWIAGRELLRLGRSHEGLDLLNRSVAAAPCPKRRALRAFAHTLPWVPAGWRGPFHPYA